MKRPKIHKRALRVRYEVWMRRVETPELWEIVFRECTRTDALAYARGLVKADPHMRDVAVIRVTREALPECLV